MVFNDESIYTDGNYKEYDCDICGGVRGFEVSDDSWERKLVKDCRCK